MSFMLQHVSKFPLFQAEKFPFIHDPDTLLTAASVLVIGASKFLHVNFQKKFCICCSPPAPPVLLVFRVRHMGVHLPSAGPRAGEPDVECRALTPQGGHLRLCIPPACVSQYQECKSQQDQVSTAPKHLSVAFYFYLQFQNIFSSSRQVILRDSCLHAVVILVCLWEEASLGFSCSTIFQHEFLFSSSQIHRQICSYHRSQLPQYMLLFSFLSRELSAFHLKEALYCFIGASKLPASLLFCFGVIIK